MKKAQHPLSCILLTTLLLCAAVSCAAVRNAPSADNAHEAVSISYNSCCVAPMYAELKFYSGEKAYLWYKDFYGHIRQKVVSREDASAFEKTFSSPSFLGSLAKLLLESSGRKYVEEEGVTILINGKKTFVPIEVIILPPEIEGFLRQTDILFKEAFGKSFNIPILPNGKDL